MLTQISSAINDPAGTASSLSAVFSSKYPNFSKNVTENYSKLTNKLNENYPGISSTLNNSTTLIYSLPGSIENKVNFYTSVFEPVDTDDSEEREISILPNENLGENVIELNDERKEIFTHILNLYSCKPSNECFKYYDENVVFDDPLIYTTGLPNLKAQFYAIHKIFVKSTTVNCKILENIPNKLIIKLKQKYTLPFISRAVAQNIDIILEFSENKIIKHADCWNGEPTGEGGILRTGLARFISTVIRVPEY